MRIEIQRRLWHWLGLADAEMTNHLQALTLIEEGKTLADASEEMLDYILKNWKTTEQAVRDEMEKGKP